MHCTYIYNTYTYVHIYTLYIYIYKSLYIYRSTSVYIYTEVGFHHKFYSKIYLNSNGKSNVQLWLTSRNCSQKKCQKKKENAKIHMLFFLRFEILKVKECLNTDDQCYPVNQFTLPPLNSHFNFHILFMYYALCFQACILTLYFHTSLSFASITIESRYC